MKIVLQKVRQASVSVQGREVGTIGVGYVLLLGVAAGDTAAQAQLLAEKVVHLRLFEGAEGKINDCSLLDKEGEILVVSQFTLLGLCTKGNRPDYTGAASYEDAEKLYAYFIEKLRAFGVRTVAQGVFGAYMEVALLNDGPVTLLLER